MDKIEKEIQERERKKESKLQDQQNKDTSRIVAGMLAVIKVIPQTIQHHKKSHY